MLSHVNDCGLPGELGPQDGRAAVADEPGDSHDPGHLVQVVAGYGRMLAGLGAAVVGVKHLVQRWVGVGEVGHRSSTAAIAATNSPKERKVIIGENTIQK